MHWSHTPDDVLHYARGGRLEEWVHAFLQTVGDNLPMSEGLRLQPRWWIGSTLLPLNLLQRCCGPEPAMEYVIDPGGWEQTMARMIASLEGGWSPSPLIAQFLPNGQLSLRDGNHRHEALRRAGRDSYWCVIWCDSEALQREAARLLAGVIGRSGVEE